MQKFIQSGSAFFLVAVAFIIIAAVSERPAVYISLGAVFFILGLGVRKKSAQKPAAGEPTKGGQQ